MDGKNVSILVLLRKPPNLDMGIPVEVAPVQVVAYTDLHFLGLEIL